MARDRSRSPALFRKVNSPVFDVSSDEEEPSVESPLFTPALPDRHQPSPMQEGPSPAPTPTQEVGPSTVRRGPRIRHTARKSVRHHRFSRSHGMAHDAPTAGQDTLRLASPLPRVSVLSHDRLVREYDAKVHHRLAARTMTVRRQAATITRFRTAASAWQSSFWLTQSLYHRLALEMHTQMVAATAANPTVACLEQMSNCFARRIEETRMQSRHWKREAEREGSLDTEDEED